MDARLNWLDQTAASFFETNYLYEEVAERLLEHLNPINIQPTSILEIGAATGGLASQLLRYFPSAELIGIDKSQQRLEHYQQRVGKPSPFELIHQTEQHLPFTQPRFDLVVANLTLHWYDNLEQILTDIATVLNDNGLLLFSYFGPDSLQEAGVRNINFIDMHDFGDMLVKKQLNHPILDSELLTVEYDHYDHLLQDLTANGELAFIADPKPTDSEVELSYEIVYGHAWKETLPMTSKIDQDGMVHIPVDFLKRT